jgi:hypothetical protein
MLFDRYKILQFILYMVFFSFHFINIFHQMFWYSIVHFIVNSFMTTRIHPSLHMQWTHENLVAKKGNLGRTKGQRKEKKKTKAQPKGQIYSSFDAY